MTRHKQGLAFVFLAVCCWAGFSLFAQSKPLVEAIEIRGTKAVAIEYVKQQIKTKVGAAHDPAQVRQDFEAVLKTGCFDTLRCSITERAAPKGGILVIFTLKETGEPCPATTRQ